jgi:hypothetical protein
VEWRGIGRLGFCLAAVWPSPGSGGVADQAGQWTSLLVRRFRPEECGAATGRVVALGQTLNLQTLRQWLHPAGDGRAHAGRPQA